jgi:uncharacterized membrane protein (UPF0136 family)
MKSGFFCFTVGLLLTLGGVGGIETSADDASLVSAVIVSGLGLMIMWAGTIMLKRAERSVDNPTIW